MNQIESYVVSASWRLRPSLRVVLLASAAAVISVAAATPAALADTTLSFTNYTTADGLSSNDVKGVYASGGLVYAATGQGYDSNFNPIGGGLSIYDGTSWSTKNTSNGLGSDNIYSVYGSGGYVYVATSGGLSISADSGATWTNKTTSNGLGSNSAHSVYASGSNVYVGTLSGPDGNGGVSVSTNYGSTFTTYQPLNTVSSNVYGVGASGDTIYAATNSGLGISIDNGTSWTIKNQLNSGLANNFVLGVYATGNNVYAATYSGLSISTNYGDSWTNYTNASTSGGLGSDSVNGVYASGANVYAATSPVYDQLTDAYVGGGLSIYNGTNWTNYTTTNGLGSNDVNGVYASGDKVYAATREGYDGNTFVGGGLSISQQSDPNQVPAPLPIFGAALPLSFCRRLRSRTKRLRHGASSSRLA